MTDLPRTPHPADAILVDRIRCGDSEAISMLYDRYADRIHGFCHGLLRNGADAADATQDTFLMAVDRIDQLRNPDRVRPWLYSIARRHALATFRSRARSTPVDDVATVATDPSTQQDGEGATDRFHSAELVDLVWDAAGGLEDRDQVVLDLHLRHDLGGDDLADALGVERDHAYTLVARAKKRLGRAVGALVVAGHGRKDCETLDRILSSWDGNLTASLRDSVNKHVDRCNDCGAKRSRLTEPAALFSAVPLTAAPIALRSDVLTAIGGDLGTTAATTGPAGTSPTSAGVSPAAATAGTAVATKVAVAVTAMVVAVAGAVGVTTFGGNEPTSDASAVTVESGAASPDTMPSEPVVEKTAPLASITSVAVSTTSAPEVVWPGCDEVVGAVQGIAELGEQPDPSAIEHQQTLLIAFLRDLDARDDLPSEIRAEIDRRLPLQEQFYAAVAAQGWQLLGGEPGHDPTSGAALRAVLDDVCLPS
ncbi:MAG: sigma-70 family RNA polymerase sigma factor [Actinomycetota bacterium]|nr:sigma-70 family RNA polymerase sigma factor [Actinomycetota bacterium]